MLYYGVLFESIRRRHRLVRTSLEEGWEIEIPSVALFPDCTDFVELVEEDGISKLRRVACMCMAKRNEIKQKTRINENKKEHKESENRSALTPTQLQERTNQSIISNQQSWMR